MSDPAQLRQRDASGFASALIAYGIWGFLPLFFVLLNAVDPFALVGWRTLWTLPFCLALLVALGQWQAFRAALANPSARKAMMVSAALIGGNWLVYIYAVQAGQFYATSIGYYISPMISVLIGIVVLKERLRPVQWAAVSLAALGVLILALAAIDSLAISLTLALSFATYGYVRKIAAVDALPGLTIEVAILLPFALAMIAFAPLKQATFGDGAWITSLLIASGPMTALPLLFFAAAARRMALSTLGFFQFLAPTIVFLTGLFVFEETMSDRQLLSFIAIWLAITLFCFDLLRQRAGQSAAEKRTGSPTA